MGSTPKHHQLTILHSVCVYVCVFGAGGGVSVHLCITVCVVCHTDFWCSYHALQICMAVTCVSNFNSVSSNTSVYKIVVSCNCTIFTITFNVIFQLFVDFLRLKLKILKLSCQC